MSILHTSNGNRKRWRISLDGWAVLLAVLAALLIRIGVLKHVPW